MVAQNQTVAFLTELRKKVVAGSISKDEAARLAVLALQEVAESEPEAPADEAEQAVEEEQVDEAKEAEPKVAPTPAPIEPKSVILAALTKFEQAISPAFKVFQEEINTLLKSTANAAVPVGDFSIDAEELNAKVTIAQKDKNTIVCTYRLKNDWSVTGVELANPVTAANEEGACHLGLRMELLAVAEEVLNNSRSNMSWNRYRVPVKDLEKIRSEAATVKDQRVMEATANTLRSSSMKSWENWALATLTQLLGSDYVAAEGKNFEDLKTEVKHLTEDRG